MKIIKSILDNITIKFYDMVWSIKKRHILLKYKKEQEGNTGMRVTGVWNYPGRFKSKEQIIELCENLRPNKSLTIGVPWKKDQTYSNQYKVIVNNENGFDIELLEADSQSYLYLKSIEKDSLRETILSVEKHCNNPKNYGYRIEYF